ncbi:MAG TPA: DNA mismatch repair protein MutS [Terriglobales bacterium]|nr:DNA mismatch repair protein MutS [Terriglobales bacterium]
MNEPSTPLMRQYSAIKKQHPNALLFFRLGDFYELFYDDAVIAARELQITLTSRNKEKDHAVPMCGVPYHAAEGYLAKLLRKGFKVAICEQMEDPKATKTIVRREVTRVVTPGTALDSTIASEDNNYLAALARADNICGLAVLDLSTGEFRATQFAGEEAEARVLEELQQLRPREVLFPSTTPLFDRVGQREAAEKPSFTETPLEDWAFAPDYAIPLVENQFGVLSLEGFGLAGRPAAAAAAGAILHYVRATQKGTLTHIDRIGFYDRQDCLILDAVTVRNLELVEPIFAGAGKEVTLFAAVDQTLTPMGKRLLRSWLLRPSIDTEQIQSRLDAVEAGVRELMARDELRRTLNGIMDLERLLSRVTLESANPRDLLALSSSLARLPAVKAAVERFAPRRFQELHTAMDELSDVRSRIEQAIVPEPPISLAEGGVIASGVDADLDVLRDLSRNSKQYIAQIEERERQRTGIHSLKVKFNSVFGYYIEISKANQHLAPPDYDRKQTLVNAERFTTPELKEYESKVLDAQEKIVDIERRLFTELRSAVAAEAKRIRQTSLAVAEVDALSALAHLAVTRDYTRPRFDDSGELEVLEGRHPVIECQEIMQSAERFVANDLYMNGASHTVLVLTGPNMGGKSTYLRQTALIAILAQIGSFVPARQARLPIFDRIFTRIGATDNLARGRSTFMVEMTETAAILNSATPRSLVLLDEMGRGTATYDGLSLAWAAIEYIHAHTKAKTLFATHYHELTDLAQLLPGVKNFHVSVRENAGGIVFLRKVEAGAADRSYGIEVAKLAGLPLEVIKRAREVLSELEQAEQKVTEHLAADPQNTPAQLTIFTPLSQRILDQLKQADLNQLTPLEALNLLHELKKQIDQ